MMPGSKSDSEAQARLATVTQNQSNCLAESARRRDSTRGGLLPPGAEYEEADRVISDSANSESESEHWQVRVTVTVDSKLVLLRLVT
jgi:hypothetical protein